MVDFIDVSDTTPVASYIVGGSPQTVFTVPFVFFSNSDLLVFVNDVRKTLGVDYNVSGAGSAVGGNITFTSAQSNATVVIERNIPVAQSTHIPTSGPLDVPGINSQFSRFVAMLQDLRNGFSSIIALSSTSLTSTTIATGSKTFTTQAGKGYAAGQTLTISSIANPANFMSGQVTAYNITSGALTVNVTTTGGSGTLSDWLISLSTIAGLASQPILFTQSGAGTLTRTVQSKLEDMMSVLDFIPQTEHAAIKAYTSTTDLSTYLNLAIAAAASAHCTLFWPSGKYRIASTIGQTGMRDVVFQGAGGLDLTYAGNSGTVIEFVGTGAVNIVNMSDHRGVWVRDIQVVYSSNAFTGTFFNCATTFTTGCGSGFENVQCYQITNTGHSAAQCYYVKNNVDVTFRNCYVSHANNGWLGLFDGETGETNIIKLFACTSIALKGAAIVNPTTGWSLYGHNFEASDTTTPSGILSTPSKIIINLQLYSCVFADALASGNWIEFDNDTIGFGMFAGALLALGGTVNGIVFSAGAHAAPVIENVFFSGIATGINFNSFTACAFVVGNNMVGAVTPVAGAVNLDAASIVIANNGLAPRAIPAIAGGTGQIVYTAGDMLYASGTTTLAKLAATANRLVGINGSGIPSMVTMPAAGLALAAAALSLANDVAALEALSSTGLAARTATDTWAQRSIVGTTAGIAVTNGDGVSGNPTLALAFPSHFINLPAQSVNANAVADTTFNPGAALPAGFTRYRITGINLFAASVDLSTATQVQFALFSGAGGTGTAILTATACTISSTAANTALNAQFNGPTITALFDFANVFFRITTAKGSAATVNVTLTIQPYA